MKRIIYLLLLALMLSACAVEGAEGTEPVTVVTENSTELCTELWTEAPTEPQPEVFTLSFVGDCTLGCTDGVRGMPGSFIGTVGEDYDYPLANVRRIFEADDFTLANLEGPLTDTGIPMEKEFVFRGPPAYAAILAGSGVEAVTTSNNHFYDYGEAGMRSTREALDAAGIAHAWRGSFLYTTGSGLTIGVYCDDFSFDKQDMKDSFASLREQGAEVIVSTGGRKRPIPPITTRPPGPTSPLTPARISWPATIPTCSSPWKPTAAV